MAGKIDLTKEFREYYQAPKEPKMAVFSKGKYLSIEGKGEPGGKDFSNKVEVLYPVAYAVKKICKEMDRDFAVSKLEGLWWVDGKKEARTTPRNQWNWKLLIRMPDFVKKEMVVSAKEQVAAKKHESAELVNFEVLENGKCFHVMHIGPYSEEPATIDRMHAAIENQGLKVNGLHHEIYLSDPRKTEPSKLKTILRQPVQ